MNSYEESLMKIANQRIWMPAVVKENGEVENITQAYVKTKGAYKGETNYKTRKRPTKYGKYHVETGTFVANKHTEVTVLKTKELDVDARILKLGRNVRATQLDGWDGILAQACRQAALELSARKYEALASTEIDSEEI